MPIKKLKLSTNTNREGDSLDMYCDKCNRKANKGLYYDMSKPIKERKWLCNKCYK